MRMSLMEIERAVQADRSKHASEIVPSGYSIDSRTIKPGECFIAIQGKNHDGHQFITEASQKGASLVLSQRDVSMSKPVPVLRVQDTLVALQALACYARRKWGKKLVAVTGSTGKTTTKEITAFLLEAQLQVFKTQGNFNNEYGLPLSLLKLEEKDELAVVELGMSAAGEIARLSQIAQPDIGVVTNVRPVHLEFFSSMEGIARAKRELVESLPPGGIAILNNDDGRVRKFGRYFPGRIVTYGVRFAATYRVTQIQDLGLDGCRFELAHPAGRHWLECPLLGIHNVANCLPAIAAAHCLGLPLATIVERTRLLKPLPGRGEILRFERGFTVINDSYNSNPAALGAMIRVLRQVPGFRRRILLAGEMLELGPSSANFHRQCGVAAASAGLDLILGVRGLARYLVDAARGKGISSSNALFFDDAISAGAWLGHNVHPLDLILVKGSRGVKTELAIEQLKSHHCKGDAGVQKSLS